MPSTILIVDDELSVLDLIAEALEAAGYTTITAVNGRGALDVIAGRTVDLLITDAHMPGIDGLELLMTARSRQIPLPAIVMSGYQSDLSDERWRDKGVAAFLSKPFTPMELRSAVIGALKAN